MYSLVTAHTKPVGAWGLVGPSSDGRPSVHALPHQLGRQGSKPAPVPLPASDRERPWFEVL